MNPPTTTPELADGGPMVVVHTAFRRELGLAAGLVRRVAEGDTTRAGVVASHLDLVLRGLEHHHQLEDALLWPRLHGRVPEEVEPVIELMEAQHATLHPLLQRLADAVPSWARTAAAAARDDIAHVLAELHAALTEHLDAEEQHLLPIAVEHLTPAEWEEIGRRAERANRGRERTLVFGLLQYQGDPAVVASMLRAAPLPARVLVPVLARRAFRRHALAVHGTATP